MRLSIRSWRKDDPARWSLLPRPILPPVPYAGNADVGFGDDRRLEVLAGGLVEPPGKESDVGEVAVDRVGSNALAGQLGGKCG